MHKRQRLEGKGPLHMEEYAVENSNASRQTIQQIVLAIALKLFTQNMHHVPNTEYHLGT